MGMPRSMMLGTCAVALVAALVSAGCSGSSEAQPAAAKPAATASGGGGAVPAAKTPDGPPEDAIAVEIAPVTRHTMAEIYGTSATLRADKQATVTARTRGVIRELLVEEGDWVDEGRPLARLENDEQRIAFDQASATADTLRREFERAEALHTQGLLSDEAFEASRRQSVDASHTAELAQLTLSRTVIRAPFGGRVLTRHVDVGATVNDGTEIYDLADLRPLYADVQVPERQVGRLDVGQTVRISVDERDLATEAAIERIAPLVDPETGTVKVTVAIRQADGLRPGSFVRVGVVTEVHADTLVVPRSALVADGRRWHLFRVTDPRIGSIEQVEVERGFEEDDLVEILATIGDTRPLNVSDPVVVRGASSLNDDSSVRVMNDGDDDEGDGVADDAKANAAKEAGGVAA